MYVLLHNKGDLLTHKQSAQGNLDSILLFEKQNVKNTGPDSILWQKRLREQRSWFCKIQEPMIAQIGQR